VPPGARNSLWKGCEATMLDTSKKTLAQIVEQSRQGGEKVWTAVEQSLSRIAEREPGVRAWTYTGALPDLKAQGGPDSTGKLAGVPFGVKDIINVAGMPTQCGSEAPSGRIEDFDACCVAMLRQAGAVPVGKTVTTEYAY